MEIFDTGINYQNADNCKQCPKRNDEQGCPWFWEWVETNGTGQERLRKSCGKQAIQAHIIEVIKASNRPAAAVEDTRNEIVKGFEKVTNTVVQIMCALQDRKVGWALPTKVKLFAKKMLGKD